MVKKGKKIWTAVVTVLFVLSVGYFALLAPTTAWFYQSYDTDYNFMFGDFDVEYTGETQNAFTETVAVTLRDATRFADAGEILFDEVIHVIKVEAANDGSVPADVAVLVANPNASDPTSNPELPDWLHYFVYAAPTGTAIVAPNVTANTKGTFKAQIETMLDGAVVTANNTTAATPLTLSDYKNMTRDASPAYAGRDNAETAYEAYNTNALHVLNAHNNEAIHFTPAGTQDSTKDVYIVFWAEYGQLPANFRSMGSVVSLGSFPVEITMRAEPAVPETQTLRLVNNGATEALLRLYLSGGTTAYTGDYMMGGSAAAATQGLIHIAANAVSTVELDVGTPYRVVLENATTMSLDSTATDGTFVNDTTANGTIGNQGCRVTVITRTS